MPRPFDQNLSPSPSELSARGSEALGVSDLLRGEDGSSRETQHSPWKRLLLVMLNVRDMDNIKAACCALEDAIFLRYIQLRNLHTVEAAEERLELKQACDRLAGVKINKLGFPIGPTMK
jgi:hypothetical protein